MTKLTDYVYPQDEEANRRLVEEQQREFAKRQLDPLPGENVKHYPSRWHFIAERTANLVSEKNTAYGDSFSQAEEVFQLLFPKGVPTERLGDVLFMARVWDKFKRFATANDPTVENPVNDILGYCILYLEKKERGGK